MIQGTGSMHPKVNEYYNLVHSQLAIRVALLIKMRKERYGFPIRFPRFAPTFATALWHFLFVVSYYGLHYRTANLPILSRAYNRRLVEESERLEVFIASIF